MPLYKRKQPECLGIAEEPAESLRVRIKERTGKGDFIVGVYYRLSEREE